LEVETALIRNSQDGGGREKSPEKSFDIEKVKGYSSGGEKLQSNAIHH